MTCRSSIFSLAFLMVAAASNAAPTVGKAPVPFILSAHTAGKVLVVRGSDLIPGEGIAPFVALSGEPLEVLPPVSRHEIRVALPDLPDGTYLLTVAAEPQSRQAGVLAVSLAPASRAPRLTPASHADGVLHACANRRHLRIVDEPTDCKRSETAMLITGSVDDTVVDDGSGEDQGSGDDEDIDETEDPEDGGPTTEDGEDDDSDCPGNSGGHGNGNGKNCDDH